MRKITMILLLSMLLGTCTLPAMAISEESQDVIQEAQQDYEKWGRVAVRTIGEAYEGYDVYDYEYEGRETPTDTIAEDTFELKIRSDGQEITKNVRVRFNTQTGDLLQITVVEE
ncbi:DUF3889 domain-containing protein [Caldalkalibacillus salinus]|uniref:DUF3889 domain-containing protein n=1 Tax=Caldalkalibacillus salinus TaxID=2803787 RepID=UPI00192493ED|nr:DUF3889 domain-containing protein [Caldalkalibacillus salinus]